MLNFKKNKKKRKLQHKATNEQENTATYIKTIERITK